MEAKGGRRRGGGEFVVGVEVEVVLFPVQDALRGKSSGGSVDGRGGGFRIGLQGAWAWACARTWV